jgi:Na+/melibiose symporter-like transporter
MLLTLQILKWFYIVISIVNPIVAIALIGEERKPYTKTYAVLSVVTSVVFLWFLFNIQK